MCWKKERIEWPHSQRVALLQGINKYPNSSHNLNGCINDIKLAQSKLENFQIREFINNKVTRRSTKEQLEYVIANSVKNDTIIWQYSGHGSRVKDQDGDEHDGYDETLYLYDGNLIDDEINIILQKIPDGVTMLIILDSCFSGTATRGININKVRYVESKRTIGRTRRIKKALPKSGNWMVISACQEHESAYDAYINGQNHGALSYYLWNTYNVNLTYKQWFNSVLNYLPDKIFKQTPTIEGPDYLLNKLLLT